MRPMVPPPAAASTRASMPSAWRRAAVAAASLALPVLLAACGAPGPGGDARADRQGLSFFVTSANPGRGGDLGGLAGADAHCQKLAATVGAGGRTWRAYLSAQPTDTSAGVNARDRIGRGPWRNAKGEVVAHSVAELHGTNALNKATALTERGETVSGRGDPINLHDVLTGSQPDGTFIAGNANSTCSNWRQSEGGAAMVGHHDRRGLDESAPMLSWNSSHQSRGCSLEQLKTTGGGGLYYCFAAD